MMSRRKPDVNEALVLFREQLAADIQAWAAAQQPPVKQKELAARLGVRPTTVNNNIRNPHSMSAGFIELISRHLPQFSHVLQQYRELLDARFADDDGAEKAVAKAEAIRELRAAGKEVCAAVNGLVDAAVRAISDR